MSDFRELTDRATAKLRRDRELRLEVTRELESHLEAAAAEFVAADYSEEDAHAAAVKAFGDPDAVANDLWDANRFRLKLRAWAWWAARLTLLPACVLAALVFIVSGLTATTRLNEVSAGVGPHEERLIDWQEKRLKAKMTDDQRLIYFGDESAADPITRWRAVRDAHPDEVLDQLELISVMLSELPNKPQDNPDQYLASRHNLLVELERGAAMDPDNGIYALIAAGVALHGFEFDREDPDAYAVVRTLKHQGSGGEREDFTIYRWPAGADETVLAEALSWYEVSADRPYLSMHTSDRVRRRLVQLPAPRSMQEYLMRVSAETQTLLPSLGLTRKVSRAVCAEALRRAEAGDAAGAIELLDQLDSVNATLAASSDTLISLLVAWSIESLEWATRVAVWQAVGDEAKAAAALERSDALVRYRQNHWNPKIAETEEAEALRSSGILISEMISAVPGYDVDTTPFRKAEYSLMDRGVLTAGLLALIVLSGLASLSGVWTAWRKRETDETAVLLWIGWKRLATVIGGAVGLPVLGFMVWLWTPWSGRGYGLNYTYAALIWYIPLVFGALLLTWRMGSSAVWRRAKEVGVAVPAERGWGRDVVAAAAFLALAITLWKSIMWEDRYTYIGSFGWTLASAAAVILAVVIAVDWLAREIIWARGLRRLRSALLRSVLVGLVATALLGAVLVMIVWHEMDAVDRVPMSIFVLCIGGVVGILAAFLWLAGRPGETAVFGRSVVRSMGPVWAVAGLTLAITVGVGLNLRERALASQMVEMSPVWIDLEIEKSHAKAIRAYLAGDAPPPRRP